MVTTSPTASPFSLVTTFKLSDPFERCANSFFDNSLIALHSFSFTQKIKDHSSLLSICSIYKSDVPRVGIHAQVFCTMIFIVASTGGFCPFYGFLRLEFSTATANSNN